MGDNRLFVAAKTRVLAAVAVLACTNGLATPSAVDDPLEIRAPNVIAFVDVRVVTMTDDRVLDHRTVIVRDGRIERIDAASSAPLPPNVVVIEGANRFLMPALVDMHVHLRRADLPAYLRAGIATVRNMWGHSGIPGMIGEIEDGTRLGPTVYSTGPGLDGTPPQWPETRIVTSIAEADAAVQAVLNDGFRVMKVYQSLSVTAYDAIMAAAQRHGITAVGHVPTAVPVQTALLRGQRSIEHLTGYDRAVSRQGRIGTWGWVDVDETRYSTLVQATLAAKAWNCPTLAIYAKLSEQHAAGERAAILANRRRFVRELSRSGAALLAGSDAGIEVVSPGVSLHDELDELVRAGLTPYQALRAATVDAGRFLEVSDLGTIVAGAPAQLMLIEGNPLVDVGNARRQAGLVLRGEWFSIARLRTLVQ